MDIITHLRKTKSGDDSVLVTVDYLKTQPAHSQHNAAGNCQRNVLQPIRVSEQEQQQTTLTCSPPLENTQSAKKVPRSIPFAAL